jgi:formamidopyrimidine-DNA glycosylase
VGFVWGDGQVAWLVDDRRFARLTPAPDLEAAVAEDLGPDALAPLSGAALAARLAGRGALKTLLMNQRRLAGLGNIHAAEALHRARLSPFATPQDLQAAEWARLARAIHAQVEEAVAETDAEEVAYLSDGKHVANPFRVYGRAGQPCPACGERIARRTQGGRSTFWCPRCQPDPRPGA